MTTTDLTALAALAEAATPGPWKRNSSWVETDAVSERDDIVSGRNSWTDERFKNSAANLTYIAAASPTTILALIRRVQAAEAELAATRAAIAEWRKEHWAAAADTTLMETMDRIAEGILK